jgi:branched-chain amino acid transport system substrate-binding protein
VGSDPAKIKSYLEQLHGFTGVVGTYNFSPTDHRGLGLNDVAVVQIKNGGFVYAGK